MKSKNTSNNAVEILIAEDSPTQAEQLRYLLEGHGCKVWLPTTAGKRSSDPAAPAVACDQRQS